VSKIFFDTNLFVYLFEGLEPWRSRMLAMRRRMLDRGDRVVTSAMTLGEVLIKPAKMGQTVNFDSQVARRYASLRAAHNIRHADSIQLACAAHVGVDLFITSDKRLYKLDIPGVGFIAPLDKVPL
jgi:predicted nucleic acid-binding protein